MPSQDLIVVEETGSHIAMTPLYAYAPRGERAIGKGPRNYGSIMTLIASLSLDGMGPAFVLDRAADSSAFEVDVEQLLAPGLRPGQIVILDNLSIHLGPRVKQAYSRSWLSPPVSARVLAGLFSHRRGFLQAEVFVAAGRDSQQGSSPGGHCNGVAPHHDF